MKLFKNKLQVFITLVFLGYLLWWLSFQSVVENQGLAVQWYGGTYGVIALFGSVVGFVAAQKWGGFRTVLGKALTFFSLGLLAQEAGQLIYTYYIYGAKIQIPYPSWGDVAYFGSVILYILATFYLAKAAGVGVSLRKTSYKLVAFAVPIALLAVSYGVFLYQHEYDFSQPLTVFLDFGYPMGQAIYISLALVAFLLSRKLLGGVMRAGIVLVIIAMFAQYISDFTFVYQSSRGTYLSGTQVELLYLIAYFLTATAMIKFYTTYKELRAKTNG